MTAMQMEVTTHGIQVSYGLLSILVNKTHMALVKPRPARNRCD